MYKHEGKSIEVPYGRRNVNVTKLEFQDAIAALAARVEALEAIVLSNNVEDVAEPEAIEDEQVDVVGEQPKPRRGRKPKEAQE